jgi:hypothetical protein
MSFPLKEKEIMRMDRIRRILLCSTLALCGCEVIGDMSETVGSLVSPHLENMGGGPPVLADDGGLAVNWYLHQVAAESYESCDSWRKDALKAALSGDKELREKLEARAEVLGEEFQPDLDGMGLSLSLQVPAPVGERLGGGTLVLDTCSVENCALGCEGLFTVQEVEEENDQGEKEVMTWSKPDRLRQVGDRTASKIVCNRHPLATIDTGTVDENYEDWKWDLAIAGGEDPEDMDAYSGPKFSIDFDLEEDEEKPDEIEAGVTLKVRVSGLDGCFEHDGSSVGLHAPSEPEIRSPTIECAEGGGDVAAGSLIIGFKARSPEGPLALGLEENTTQLELMVSETNPDDFTPELVFHYSQDTVGCALPEDAAEESGLKEMRAIIEDEMDEDAFNQIKSDDRKVKEAYKKHLHTNPDQPLECKITLGEKELGDFECGEDGKNYSYELIFKDKDGRWSRKVSAR